MQLKLSFLLFLTLYLFSKDIYVSSLRKEKIIGGNKAEIGEFPYMVSLRLNGKHECGGALISDQHVLTAYHCIKSGYDKFIAVVGTNSLTSGGDVYRIKKALIYPPYDNNVINDSFDHDIAVLKLERRVKLSDLVSTIPLPVSELKVGSRVQFTGWGEDSTLTNSIFLQKLQVTTIPRSDCVSYYQSFGYGKWVKSQNICAIQKDGHGACFGDSGAPLIYNGTVAGVLSVGLDHCGTGIPDLFENVHFYVDFIKNAMTQ